MVGLSTILDRFKYELKLFVNKKGLVFSKFSFELRVTVARNRMMTVLQAI